MLLVCHVLWFLAFGTLAFLVVTGDALQRQLGAGYLFIAMSVFATECLVVYLTLYRVETPSYQRYLWCLAVAGASLPVALNWMVSVLR